MELRGIMVFPEAGEESMLVTTRVILLIMSMQKLTFLQPISKHDSSQNTPSD